MNPELELASKMFIELARHFRHGPAKMGDTFEEWLFWNIPATSHFRSSRQGVAEVQVPRVSVPIAEIVLWQSLLEHPDIVLEGRAIHLGIECKSLEASQNFVATRVGIPCRTTIDFNSTVPCGLENFKGKFVTFHHLKGKPLRLFYACALYGEIGRENHIISLLMVDGNYLNRDYQLHLEHRNISRPGFGSYGDGQIRERKMYLFPNPMTDDSMKGTVSLVIEDANVSRAFPQLNRVGTKVKTTPEGKKFPFYVYQLSPHGSNG